MFDKNFYPTPQEVLEMMLIDCRNKVVLEPQAGKGDIIDFCKLNGAKSVYSFELNNDLAEIVKSKSIFLGYDFLEATAEQISHVQLIVMNPPFDNSHLHILHAYKIAPDGCEIISLCNWETIAKDYNYRELNRLISTYGITQNLGNCFNTAERKTNVEVGLIRLFKPVTSANFDFNGYFSEEEDEQELEGEGILPYNEIKALVNRYVGTMKNFDNLKEQIDLINYQTKQIGFSDITLNLGYNNIVTNKIEFGKSVQKASWAYIFNKMNMQKHVTSGVMRDINRFVEEQSRFPFTMKNIYKMFEMIIGTRSQTMDRALEEVVDNFTKHTHENRFGVSGWKTNSGYMLNKKFIIDYMFDVKWGGGKIEPHYARTEKLTDLIKVLCNLTGTNYDGSSTYSLTEYSRLWNGFETNKWHEWGFFRFKGFKKGTMHLEFTNTETWELLNKNYARIKGEVLPEKEADKRTERQKEKAKEEPRATAYKHVKPDFARFEIENLFA